MESQARNAKQVAEFLQDHPKIERVNYLGFLDERNPAQYKLYKKQCLSPGAMLSFDIVGGEKEAFMFLNNLKLIKLAVSLGSTESLAEHPATMTHMDIDEAEKLDLHITGQLIRLSVGVEHYDDLIADIEQALECVKVEELELA
jgi:methionine-gamma-lyase